MKREVEIGSLTRVIILFIGVICALVWFSAATNPNNFHAAIGLTSLVVVLAPFLVLRRYDLFSPWSIVILGVVSGCANPAIATSLGWPDMEEIERHSLLGQEPGYFIYPGLILILGLICLAVGYFTIPTTIRHRYSLGRRIAPGRLYLAVFALVFVAVAATGAFVKFTGGGSDRISQKRTTIRTIDVSSDKDFSQYGYLRTISTVSSIGFLVLFAYWASNGRKLQAYQILILLGIFLSCCVLPFYASTRAPLIWIFLSAMGMMYYTNQKGLLPKFTILFVAALGLIIVVTVLRTPNAEIADELNDMGKHLVFNRNGPELAKTAHIINNVPEKLSFQYGKTIAVWLIAPIPRELLPGKPLIHYGPVIGRMIYGNNVSGVPPGLVAEMYLNFHIPGVIFGCLFFGWMIRKIYELIFSIEGEMAIVIPMYLFAFLQLPYKALANSFGSGILCLVDLVMLGAIVYLFTVAKNQYQVTPNRHDSGDAN